MRTVVKRASVHINAYVHSFPMVVDFFVFSNSV